MHVGLSLRVQRRRYRQPGERITKRFTEMTGYSELFFALAGYAVLDNAAMPMVGAIPIR